MDNEVNVTKWLLDGLRLGVHSIEIDAATVHRSLKGLVDAPWNDSGVYKATSDGSLGGWVFTPVEG